MRRRRPVWTRSGPATCPEPFRTLARGPRRHPQPRDPSGSARSPRASRRRPGPAPCEPAPRRAKHRPLRGSLDALGFDRGADSGENAAFRKNSWSSSNRLAPVNPAADSRSPGPALRGLSQGSTGRHLLRGQHSDRFSGRDPGPETVCGSARTRPAFGQEMPKAESTELLGALETRRPALRPPSGGSRAALGPRTEPAALRPEQSGCACPLRGTRERQRFRLQVLALRAATRTARPSGVVERAPSKDRTFCPRSFGKEDGPGRSDDSADILGIGRRRFHRCDKLDGQQPSGCTAGPQPKGRGRVTGKVRAGDRKSVV